MTKQEKTNKAAQSCLECSPLDDFVRADLGDSRRVDRLLMITGALIDAPEKSFPDAVDGDASKLEALYRFFGNDNVDPQAIVKPHIESTCHRVSALGRAYVIQDTTDLTYESRDGEHHRKGLENHNKYTQTLHVHLSLAVSADGSSIPLGLLGFMTWTNTEEDKASRAQDWTRANRWYEQVEHCRRELSEDVELIHLWDREGDSYENLVQLADDHEHYIIRVCHENRSVLDEDSDATGIDIRAALATEAVRGRRKIKVGARRKNRSSKNLNKFPPRKKRQASVGVRAACLRLKRPKNRSRHRQPFLEVNVVEVVEHNPPQGEEPISWYLLTSEPIDTEEQIWEVVDGYRVRWVIEEFFKCLKTGCAVEKRQLKSRKSLERMLALMMPLAWRILLMREFYRSPLAEHDAILLFRSTELAVLAQAAPRHTLGTNPTLREATLAMASLGGHLKQSGPPGWLTLWRGFRTLQDLHKGYLLGLQSSVEG